mmetsp:Transcript_29291/g.84929  ORF Transcript_29291/g.84929 Transcript_29291/m.84929 type:complete len:226 (+) Transcript_29291:1180-1857(+)
MVAAEERVVLRPVRRGLFADGVLARLQLRRRLRELGPRLDRRQEGVVLQAHRARLLGRRCGGGAHARRTGGRRDRQGRAAEPAQDRSPQPPIVVNNDAGASDDHDRDHYDGNDDDGNDDDDEHDDFVDVDEHDLGDDVGDAYDDEQRDQHHYGIHDDEQRDRDVDDDHVHGHHDSDGLHDDVDDAVGDGDAHRDHDGDCDQHFDKSHLDEPYVDKHDADNYDDRV